MRSCENCHKPVKYDNRFCSEECRNKIVCTKCGYNKYSNAKHCPVCAMELNIQLKEVRK